MKIKNAKFLISSPNLKLCPELNMPEFALLGRSNVGKSTFINKKPFILADLPGYGYAKVSKKEQDTWQKNLEEYLLKRPLTSTIQFIDARHDIQKNDILMQEWLKFNNIPCVNILTKCDYISRNEINKKIAQVEKQFQNKALAFSSKNRIYVDGVLAHLNELMG